MRLSSSRGRYAIGHTDYLQGTATEYSAERTNACSRRRRPGRGFCLECFSVSLFQCFNSFQVFHSVSGCFILFQSVSGCFIIWLVNERRSEERRVGIVVGMVCMW